VKDHITHHVIVCIYVMFVIDVTTYLILFNVVDDAIVF
jgi:hypothetical protein